MGLCHSRLCLLAYYSAVFWSISRIFVCLCHHSHLLLLDFLLFKYSIFRLIYLIYSLFVFPSCTLYYALLLSCIYVFLVQL